MSIDLLLVNARVMTLDPGRPEAQAVAVRDGRIAWVGSDAEARAHLTGVGREVDLGGATVTPGFIDAHHHVILTGHWLTQINCAYPAVRSIEDILAAVDAAARQADEGAWVQGRGYDDNKLAERRHLTRWDLDRVGHGHPVVIRNASGHMCVVNSVALQQAGIGRETVSPFGGHVVTDDDGEPTGLLQEKAQELLDLPYVPQDKAHLHRCLQVAGDAYRAAGVTSGHEAGIFSTPEFTVFQEAWAAGTLPLRTYMMVRQPFIEAVEQLGMYTGFGDDRLRVGSIKLIGDGSLIGRTAAVCEPFEHAAADDLGLAMFTQEELDDLVWRGHRAGWQMAIHAIGDRGIEMCLDAYAAALRRLPRADHRHRIEHCGVLRPDLIARMAEMGVIPSGQPPFIAEYGDGFLEHLGPSRSALTYPIRSLLAAGIPLAGGSDSPVSSLAPLIGIQAAVTERTASGAPFAPAEAVSVEEAIGLYTRNAAYAAFEEDRKGTVTPGKLADLTVLARDPRTEPGETIAEIPVLATIQGGEFVYERGSSAHAAAGIAP